MLFMLKNMHTVGTEATREVGAKCGILANFFIYFNFKKESPEKFPMGASTVFRRIYNN